MNDVVYIGCTDEQVHWGGCDDPRGLLQIDGRYRVSRIEEHSWHTKLILEDFPEKAFNSACFQEIAPEPERAMESPPLTAQEYQRRLEAYMTHAKPILRAMADLSALYTSRSYVLQGTTLVEDRVIWHSSDAEHMYAQYEELLRELRERYFNPDIAFLGTTIRTS